MGRDRAGLALSRAVVSLGSSTIFFSDISDRVWGIDVLRHTLSPYLGLGGQCFAPYISGADGIACNGKDEQY